MMIYLSIYKGKQPEASKNIRIQGVDHFPALLDISLSDSFPPHLGHFRSR